MCHDVRGNHDDLCNVNSTMNERDFKTAVKRLREFARDWDVKVRFVSPKTMYREAPGALGYYQRTNKTVAVVNNMSREKTVYVFSHELGHSVDWGILTKKRFQQRKRASDRFTMMMENDLKIPKQVFNFMVTGEEVAFSIGEEILRELSINISKKRARKWKGDSLRSCKKMIQRSGR